MVVETLIKVVAKEALEKVAKEAAKQVAKTAAGKAIQKTVISVVKNVPRTAKTVIKVANTAKAIASNPAGKAKDIIKKNALDNGDDALKEALSVFDETKDTVAKAKGILTDPEKALKKEIKDAFKKEEEKTDEKSDDTYSKNPNDMTEEELAEYGTLSYKSIPKNVLNDIRKQDSSDRPLKTLCDTGWDHVYRYSYNWFCKNNGFSSDLVDFDEIVE